LTTSASSRRRACTSTAPRKELDPEEPSRGLDACGGGSFNVAYFNRVDVQKALNVYEEGPVSTASQTGWEWAECSSAPFFNYTKTTKSHTALYQEHLIPEMRVTIFSGDVDACVPYLGTSRWVDDVVQNTNGIGEREPWPEVGPGWSSWDVDANVAGYFSTWDVTGTDHTFTFATVKGAGHMVPEVKPKSAGSLFYRFLHDLPMDYAEKQPVAIGGNGRPTFDAARNALRVAVEGGTAPYSFEWYRNDVLVEGSWGPTLALTDAMAADETAEYHCHVVSALGSTAWTEGVRTGDSGAGGAGSDDSCRYAFDGECDDGSQGGTQYCALGTDATDCAATAVAGGGGGHAAALLTARKQMDLEVAAAATGKSALGDSSAAAVVTYGGAAAAADVTEVATEVATAAADVRSNYAIVGAIAFVAGAAFFGAGSFAMRSCRQRQGHGSSDDKGDALLLNSAA
jgi:hypothetical protein